MISFEQWRQEYYEVITDITVPIVVCDEWSEPIDEIWSSYVVYSYKAWHDGPLSRGAGKPGGPL